MSRHYPKTKSTTQRCPKCGITKPHSEFPPHPGRANGCNHYCYECVKGKK